MHFFAWLERVYLYLNKDEGHSPEIHDLIVVSMVFLATILLGGFALTHFFYGDDTLAMIQTVLGLVFLVTLLIPNNKLAVHYKEDIAITSLIILFWSMLALGGIANTGIYWPPMLPFIVFTMSGIKKGFKWLLFYFMGVFVLQAMHYNELFLSPYSYEQTFYFLTAFVVYTLIALIFEVVRTRYRQDLEEYNQKLEQSQERLNEVLNGLEKEVELRTSELKGSNKRLQQEIKQHQETNDMLRVSEQKFFQSQKMESLGTLVHGLVHDFNHILSKIDEGLFFIQRKIKGDALVQDRLDEMEKLTGRAAEMTRQLMIFARKEAVKKETFELAALMRDVFNLSKASLPLDIRVEKTVSDAHMPVVGNSAQLQQVMMNLFNNARDALKDCAQPSIQIHAMPLTDAVFLRDNHPVLQGEWFYLSMRDNGKGIAAKHLPHIFDPFFSTKEFGTGTGLGLAMCYGAIHSHGGIIEVESRQGHGASFHIYLPNAHVKTIEPQNHVVSPKLFGKSETILIIDDDESHCVAHKMVLESLNYKVIWVKDGVEAIKLYVEIGEHIDLMVMDLQMPNIGGIRTAQHILMINRDAKILFSSANELAEELATLRQDEAKELAHINCLRKPFTVEQMCLALREELEL